MSTSADSGPDWPARAGSSTSARTPRGWCSSGPSSYPAAAGSRTAGWSSPTEPSSPKFLADVEQRTFSGEYAAAAGQPVLYVTERCVFQLTAGGLELIEIAPWVDLEKDILAHIGFEPIIKR